MRVLGLAGFAVLFLLAIAAAEQRQGAVPPASPTADPGVTTPLVAHAHATPLGAGPREIRTEALTAVVRRVCGLCHNDALRTGNLSLQDYDVAQAARRPEISEKMITKLRAGMMPPPGIPRPGGDTLRVLVETLEQLLDDASRQNPDPGGRTFQRLNRTEYESSIRELLTL